MSGYPGIGPSQAWRSSAYVFGTHVDGTGLNALMSSPAALKNNAQSMDGGGVFVSRRSSRCGGTLVNCVRWPARSVTTSRMFEMFNGGSSKPGLQISAFGSRSRGLVRYQKRRVGKYGLSRPLQRVA